MITRNEAKLLTMTSEKVQKLAKYDRYITSVSDRITDMARVGLTSMYLTNDLFTPYESNNKKDEVTNFLIKYLRENGFTVDEATGVVSWA